MQQTITILGGSGFVGRHLVARLLEKGYSPRVLTRSAETCRELGLPDEAIVELDVYHGESIKAALQGSAVVINLIGILNEKGHDGSGFVQAHAQLPALLTRCCVELGISRLVHMSALGADAQAAPSHYLRSKGAGNEAIRAAAGTKLQWTLIQPSVIFGPDDSFFMRFAGLLRFAPVFPLACPGARFAPVYVEDVVEAFVRSLDNPATHGQRIEACGPQVMTLHEVVSYVARTAGMRRWIIGLNDFLSRLQANIMEYVPGKPFSRDNYLSTRIDSVCGQGSGALSLADLGIKPTPIEAVMPAALRKQ